MIVLDTNLHPLNEIEISKVSELYKIHGFPDKESFLKRLKQNRDGSMNFGMYSEHSGISLYDYLATNKLLHLGLK